MRRVICVMTCKGQSIIKYLVSIDYGLTVNTKINNIKIQEYYVYDSYFELFCNFMFSLQEEFIRNVLC